MRTKEFWVKQLGESWTNALKPLLKTEYMEQLIKGLSFDYALCRMYPYTKEDIFKALRLCPYDKIRVVIIGTEPNKLTGEGGLAFSDYYYGFQNPSAMEIRNCIEREYGKLRLDFDFTFESWAKQGILMLNRSLVCHRGETKSHKEDFKQFFGSILYLLEKEKHGTIFLLWGKEAQKYSELLSQNHHVFSWEHPMKANTERRQWDCPNFKQVNELLKSKNEEEIKW
jgi:uracil-DNA glycosylase